MIIIEYQKIINLLGNTPNQSYKLKTKDWIEINDELRETYDKDNQIRFKASMLRTSVSDYSDGFILAKGTMTVANTAAQGVTTNNGDKNVIVRSCAPFTNCIRRINYTQIIDALDIDVVMSICNLIEYSDNYPKISKTVQQHCRDEPAVNAANGSIVDFNEDNVATNLFKIK